jgi:hypothetical protein
MGKEITISIVPDEACPKCGAIWGHEDKLLDYPNRPKVGDENGVWWWRCYNPKCPVSYYDPNTGEIEEDEITREQAKELMKQIDSMPIPDIPDLE